MSADLPALPHDLSRVAGSKEGSAPPPPRIPDHELLRCIGKGSYGEVWLARNVMGTYRAVKIVHRRNFEDDRPYEREFEGIQRFEPISRSHPSQVNILHVGRNDEAGCFYYVMELADQAGQAASLSSVLLNQPKPVAGAAAVEHPSPALRASSPPVQRGERDGGKGDSDFPLRNPHSAINPESYQPRTLRSELQVRGRLPVEECIEIGLSLATALEHLHGHGLVHRDIKPANIIFIHGIPKLADIGLVTNQGDGRSFVGTEGYLPPEGPGSPQADLYSLGKVLYEMATGHDRMDFPELPTDLGQLPERQRLLEFNELLLKACADKPDNRYQSAAALRADLQYLQDGHSLCVRRAKRRRRQVLAGIGVLCLPFLVFTLWHSRRLAPLSTFPLPAHANQATSYAVADWSNDGFLDLLMLRGRELAAVTARGQPLRTRLLVELSENGNPSLLCLDDGDPATAPFVVLGWREPATNRLSVVNANGFLLKEYAHPCPRPLASNRIEPAPGSIQALCFAHLEGPSSRQLLTAYFTGHTYPSGAPKPRGLACFDWSAGHLLWDYPLAGAVGACIVLEPGNSDARIILTSTAPANGVRLPDGTDDAHSYVLVLDKDGRCLWRRLVNDYYSSASLALADLRGNGQKTLIAAVRRDPNALESPKETARNELLQLDPATGEIRARFDLPHYLLSLRAFDLDGDRRDEILLTDRAGNLHLFGQTPESERLQLVQAINLVRPIPNWIPPQSQHGNSAAADTPPGPALVELEIIGFDDLDGDGQRELVFHCSQQSRGRGNNLGIPDGEVNYRPVRDVHMLVCSPGLRPLARHTLAATAEHNQASAAWVGPFDADGRRQILAILPDGGAAVLLGYRRSSFW